MRLLFRRFKLCLNLKKIACFVVKIYLVFRAVLLFFQNGFIVLMLPSDVVKIEGNWNCTMVL